MTTHVHSTGRWDSRRNEFLCADGECAWSASGRWWEGFYDGLPIHGLLKAARYIFERRRAEINDPPMWYAGFFTGVRVEGGSKK